MNSMQIIYFVELAEDKSWLWTFVMIFVNILQFLLLFEETRLSKLLNRFLVQLGQYSISSRISL